MKAVPLRGNDLRDPDSVGSTGDADEFEEKRVAPAEERRFGALSGLVGENDKEGARKQRPLCVGRARAALDFEEYDRRTEELLEAVIELWGGDPDPALRSKAAVADDDPQHVDDDGRTDNDTLYSGFLGIHFSG